MKAGPPRPLRLASRKLGRELECWAWEGPGSGPQSPRVHFLHGSGGRSSDWFEKGRVHEMALELQGKNYIPPLILTGLPDGSGPGAPDSWYVNRADGTLDAEDLLVRELVPALEAALGALVPRERRGLAGHSMGAWGALRLGLAHPELFGAISGLSGVYNGFNLWTLLSEDVESLLGSENRIRALSPLYQAALDPSRAPVFRLDWGHGDPLAQESREMASALRKAGLSLEEDELEGNHDWDSWRIQVRWTLLFMGRILGARR